MSYYALYKESIDADAENGTLKIHDIFDNLLIIPAQTAPNGFFDCHNTWHYDCIYTLIENDKNIDGVISDEITYIGTPRANNKFEFDIPRMSDAYRVISDVPYQCIFKNEVTGLIHAECRTLISSCDRIKIRHILFTIGLHNILYKIWV